ncbi:MAG: hypothetical protein QXK06_05070 [Candidatus Diapherotrites archaeon]
MEKALQKTVLVVDDKRKFRERFAREYLAAGYRVYLASSIRKPKN